MEYCIERSISLSAWIAYHNCREHCTTEKPLMTDKTSKKRLYLIRDICTIIQICFQKAFVYKWLVLTVKIGNVIIFAANLKVFPAKEKVFLLGDNSF